ncbi:MAG: hypothetical protein AAFY70_05155 [Bacteroidota bacterium]
MEINDIINTIESSEARQSLREAMALQELEGNPFTLDEIKMFVMFERQGMSTDEQIAYLDSIHKSNIPTKNSSNEQRRTGPESL